MLQRNPFYFLWFLSFQYFKYWEKKNKKYFQWYIKIWYVNIASQERSATSPPGGEYGEWDF